MPHARFTGKDKPTRKGGKAVATLPRQLTAPNLTADIIRARCKDSFFSRIHVLEAIADGTIETYTTGPKGTTVFTPSARDRVAALDTLAKYGGVSTAEGGSSDNSKAWATAEALSRSLLAALSDPSVRRWIAQERPDIMGVVTASLRQSERSLDPVAAAGGALGSKTGQGQETGGATGGRKEGEVSSLALATLPESDWEVVPGDPERSTSST